MTGPYPCRQNTQRCALTFYWCSVHHSFMQTGVFPNCFHGDVKLSWCIKFLVLYKNQTKITHPQHCSQSDNGNGLTVLSETQELNAPISNNHESLQITCLINLIWPTLQCHANALLMLPGHCGGGDGEEGDNEAVPPCCQMIHTPLCDTGTALRSSISDGVCYRRSFLPAAVRLF